MYKTITFIALSFLVLTSSAFSSTSSETDEGLEHTQSTVPIINLENKGEAATYFCQKALVGTYFHIQGEPNQITYRVMERTSLASKKSWSVNEDILSDSINLLEFLNNSFNYSEVIILAKIISVARLGKQSFDLVRKDNSITIQCKEEDCNYIFFLDFSKIEKGNQTPR